MLNKDLKLSKRIFSAHIRTDSTRNGLGAGLLELAETKLGKEMVVLTADLMESTRTHSFEEKYPEKFVQVGVAEQNMAGVAAGLAMNGKMPFMTSFSAFSPGRNWEQIRVSICYSNVNVKIASTHSGLSADKDGATHQALEDIALTRTLPNMTVIAPSDYKQTIKAVRAAAEIEGPVYIRLSRNKSPIFTTKSTPFKVGVAQVLKEGSDVTLISFGPLIYETLKAARELKLKYQIEAEVINCHTLKPLDELIIVRSAKKTGRVFTIEEHQVSGGLGGAVSELLSESFPAYVHKIGIEDTFTESGSYKNLVKKYNLDSASIVKKVKNSVLRARAKK